MKKRIISIIDRIVSVCDNWICKGEDGLLRFVDPNDGVEISAHYGATHSAASFIIWGKIRGDESLYSKGVALLDSIIHRWNLSKSLPAFHFDFNNFALIVASNYVDVDLAERIKQIVCQTCDSNHDTINWLPMRWAVNKKRLEWNSDAKYQSVINHCKNTILKASNADGGIEDRLPHGMSFNLQYDLATVAVLQYLNVGGENIDLSKHLGFLLNAVSPDGDINYQGRGTNQVFAWGLWVYLLASSGRKEDLSKALDFLSSRLDMMLKQNSMMLNDWEGKEKYLWWDYHYASVYISHCLLWLILSIKDYGKAPIIPILPTSIETGLHIHRTENNFVSWFDGRSEYLAEKGPAISCIWTKSQGIISKGAFAPWQGPFGNKHIYEDIVLKNYCGLLSVKRNKDWSKNRFVHKLIPSIESNPSIWLRPIFCPISVTESEGRLEITWHNNNMHDVIFNIPTFSENVSFDLYADDKKIATYCVESVKNQYGWVFLHQSHVFSGEFIKVIISTD